MAQQGPYKAYTDFKLNLEKHCMVFAKTLHAARLSYVTLLVDVFHCFSCYSMYGIMYIGKP